MPTHWAADRTDALLFIADTVGFVVAFVWTLTARRHWKVLAVATLAGTSGVYVWYLVSGRETADLVGLVTTTVELAAALVVLVVGIREPAAPRRAMRWTRPAVGVALVAMLATTAIVAAFIERRHSHIIPGWWCDERRRHDRYVQGSQDRRRTARRCH